MNKTTEKTAYGLTIVSLKAKNNKEREINDDWRMDLANNDDQYLVVDKNYIKEEFLHRTVNLAGTHIPISKYIETTEQWDQTFPREANGSGYIVLSEGMSTVEFSRAKRNLLWVLENRHLFEVIDNIKYASQLINSPVRFNKLYNGYRVTGSNPSEAKDNNTRMRASKRAPIFIELPKGIALQRKYQDIQSVYNVLRERNAAEVWESLNNYLHETEWRTKAALKTNLFKSRIEGLNVTFGEAFKEYYLNRKGKPLDGETLDANPGLLNDFILSGFDVRFNINKNNSGPK